MQQDKRSVTQETEEAEKQCIAFVSRILQKKAKRERYNFIANRLRISTLHLSPIFCALIKRVVVPFKREKLNYQQHLHVASESNISINRERTAFPICFYGKSYDILSIYWMVIQIFSSRSRADIMALMNRCSQMRESTTMPSSLFYPTRIQPCVSSG